jgi:hypothetical protein
MLEWTDRRKKILETLPRPASARGFADAIEAWDLEGGDFEEGVIALCCALGDRLKETEEMDQDPLEAIEGILRCGMRKIEMCRSGLNAAADRPQGRLDKGSLSADMKLHLRAELYSAVFLVLPRSRAWGGLSDERPPSSPTQIRCVLGYPGNDFSDLLGATLWLRRGHRLPDADKAALPEYP